MNQLPLGARIYLVAIYLAGAGCLFAALRLLAYLPQPNGSVWELAVFVALAVWAGGKKVALPYYPGARDANSRGFMSLGFAMIFATLLRFGPAGALIAGFAST